MESNAFTLIIVIVTILFIVGMPLAWYNKLVRLKQLIKESWGNVDVQLKRRYDLIPNLVNVVKGYAQHEKEVLEMVVEARNKAAANNGNIASQASDEMMMIGAMKKMFAMVEAYPQLKASQNFLQLQQELVNTEDRIAAARRFYNANVRDYTVSTTTFPIMIIAKMFSFPPQDYFEVDDATVRALPQVSFNPPQA